MPDLSINYAGLKLTNPIIAASSGLSDSLESLIELEAAGVGAVVLKSVFEEEILMEMEQAKMQMTGRPYIFPETMDYLDDLPDEDLIRKYLTLIKDAKRTLKIPVIASINCVSHQKWTYLATEIEKAGADALELNLFALPSDIKHAAGDTEQAQVDLVEAVCKLVNIPVMVKMSYYYTSLSLMVKKFTLAGARGIVMFNRNYSPDINIETQAITNGFVLSEASEFRLPLRWIALASGQTQTDYCATTGIHSAESVIKMVLAGATAVQIASAMYKQGPKVVNQFKTELSDWMSKHNYHQISDFKGRLNCASISDSAAWERTQFMREFRHFVL